MKSLLIFLIFITIFQFRLCESGNNSDIKVSLIIPTYNTEKFIDRCLKSAVDQTLKEIEIILIDDHSTDNTVKHFDKFKDERFKIIRSDNSIGAAAARNIGIEVAVGEFLGFFDSDDFADARFFEFLYKYSKDQDLVRGIYVDSTNFSGKYAHHHEKPKQFYGNVYDSIWRRTFVMEHNIRFPHQRRGEDVHFRIDFMKANPRYIDAPDEGIYYYYKRREGSVMNFTTEKIEKFRNKYKEGKELDEYTFIDENTIPDENISYDNVLLVTSFIVLLIVLIYCLFKRREATRKTKYNLNETLLEEKNNIGGKYDNEEVYKDTDTLLQVNDTDTFVQTDENN